MKFVCMKKCFFNEGGDLTTAVLCAWWNILLLHHIHIIRETEHSRQHSSITHRVGRLGVLFARQSGKRVTWRLGRRSRRWCRHRWSLMELVASRYAERATRQEVYIGLGHAKNLHKATVYMALTNGIASNRELQGITWYIPAGASAGALGGC